MAITREEVRIRMAVDSSALSAGMTTASAQVNRFVADTGKKLMSLARANIWLMGADLLRQALPTAEEFWNKIYGVDEASTKKYEETMNRFRSLRAEIQKTREALAKSAFDEATPEQQRDLLNQKIANLDKAISGEGADKANREKAIAGLAAEIESMGPNGSIVGIAKRGRLLQLTGVDPLQSLNEGRSELIEANAKSTAKLNKLTTERLATAKQLAEVEKKVSPETKATDAKAQMLANRAKVATLRSDFELGMATGNLDKINAARAGLDALTKENNLLFQKIPGMEKFYNPKLDSRTEGEKLAQELAASVMKVEIVKVQGE